MNNNNNSRRNVSSDYRREPAPTGEATPLLMQPSNASGDNAVNGANGTTATSQSYYFVNNTTSRADGGDDSLVRDADAGEVVDEIPEGSHTDEFAPKVLAPPMSAGHGSVTSPAPGGRQGRKNSGAARSSNGFWANWFGASAAPPPKNAHIGEIGTLVKPRKAPIKIEPKVFFANERTFLAWMHLSVTLAGASIAILAFAEDQNPFSQLYGVLLLPVAIAFIIYSMYQYARRATMIRLRHPGPYEDTVGPAILGVMLMVSIVAQFALKLYSMASV
eukprot:CAMPEP_0172472534 /NCGR_PEP_ID=MMETSP1065-20121228/68388_1 /TAXON_ID=265537 /ORGANISM="Amphiprora paludosa, Strain CCMP125" /LENGTH=274 /DNA_ID=CAMNT_0013230679 /DNA_START=468 /DNA_END=1292 /DNA_ORIENTATION=-